MPADENAGPWSTSWCPACGAITVYASVSIRAEDEHADGSTLYLACPRCDTVTVSLPPGAPRWAHGCLCRMVERSSSRKRLAALHGALGQARVSLQASPAQSRRTVTDVAPYLEDVLAEAEAAGQLEDCLVGLALVLNVVLTGPVEQAGGCLSTLLGQLCQRLEPLAEVQSADDTEDRPA